MPFDPRLPGRRGDDAARMLASLSAPDAGPSSVARRRFLQGALAVGGAMAVKPDWLFEAAHGAPYPVVPAPLGPDEKILVVVMLAGGNDGLNTVAPAESGAYRDARGDLAVTPATGHPVGQGLYLHPTLGRLKARFDQGQVAFVHGLGDPADDRSHFSSMATWLSARTNTLPPTSGWLGRYLDAGAGDLLDGVSIGYGGVPLHLVGRTRSAVALPPGGGLFGADPTVRWENKVYRALSDLGTASLGKGTWAQAVAGSYADAIGVAQDVQPALGDSLPDENGLVRDLALAAEVINLDIGVRVVSVGLGGFDTHDAQAGVHDALLAELDAGIDAFFARLNPVFCGRTALMTFSEFGRRVEANDSGGTDHGTAGPSIVVGPGVKGGHVGQQVSVTDLDGRGDLKHRIDFRSLYATMLARWLGVDDREILGRTYEHLDLFAAAGATGACGPIAFTGTELTPLTPARVLDTRNGTGVPAGKVGARSEIQLPVLGVGGVPAAGVKAVVLNVTVTEPTADSYVTVYPTGSERPLASNLNMVARQTVPNLVVAKVGDGGRVTLYNNNGATHLVADVLAYVPASAAYTGLVPARVLDTRNGTGAPEGKVGTQGVVEVDVTGVGGVPNSGVGSVVLNVTVTEPDRSSYVTVYPTGSERPLASNLNMIAGQTVPNLVVAKVGDGGRVSLYNNNGSTHLVADVLGWFPASAAYTGLVPARLLDTRDGTGAPAGKVGPRGEVDLTVTGVGGVPANGVGAVVLNVTVTEPNMPSYVTCYPNGAVRPLASNLNMTPNQTVPNLVVAKVGDGGRVRLYNNAGHTHLVADVMGWFSGA